MNRLRVDKLFYCFLLSWPQIAFSQGLFNNPAYEKGAFELIDKDICISQSVNIIDQSKGKNVKYLYDYQLESLDEIKRKSITSSNYTYSDNGQSKVYTILQVGEVNGKISLACRNVVVRSNNVPEHSFTLCGSMVEFNIPNHVLNNFDTYRLEIGFQSLVINKSDLPYSKRFPISLPGSYRLLGYYSDLSKNCQLSNSFKTIPATSIITSLPFYPNINKLELLNLSTLKLEYSGPYVGDSSLNGTLYRFEKTMSPTSAVAIHRNIIPGVYELSIPDTTKSYCYFVKKKNFCINEVEESAEICTHPLFSAKFNPNDYQNELIWSQYPALFRGVALPPFAISLLSGLSYNNSQRIKIIEDNTAVRGIIVPKGASTYKDKPIDCKKEYCYSTEQTISGTINYVQYHGLSISNKRCIDQKKVVAAAPTNLYVSTDKSLNVINYREEAPWPLKKEKWYLYKQQGKEYRLIDSLLQGIKTFIDPSPVSKAESYKVGYMDECQSRSELSAGVSSVYLALSSPNVLNWTGDSPFSEAGVTSYEVYYINNLDGSISKIDEISDNKIEVNLNLYQEEASFLVQAKGTDISQPVSTSNIQTLRIPTFIFIPTIFTPNGDGINDLLELKGKINTGDKFTLEIYNRTGQQIVQISNITQTWDGRFKGQQLASGIYPFILTIKSENGVISQKNGSISLQSN